MFIRILVGVAVCAAAGVVLDVVVATVRLCSTDPDEPYFGHDDHGGRQDIVYPFR